MDSTDEFSEMLEGLTKKELQELRMELMQQQKPLLEEREELNAELAFIQANIEFIGQKIKKGKVAHVASWKDDLWVSDHAIIRYLERIQGFNINAIRKAIRDGLPSKLYQGTTVVKKNNVIYRLAFDGIKKITVVTVLNKQRKVKT